MPPRSCSRYIEFDLSTLKYYAGIETTACGVPALLARTGYTGEDGFELFVAWQDGVAVWDTLMAAGGASGLVPVGLGARDTLRLEAGMPLYGQELDRETTPFEAGLGRVVKLDKAGDFVGRAALEAAKDRPRKALVGMRITGRGIARTGYPVYLPAAPEPVRRYYQWDRLADAGFSDRDGVRARAIETRPDRRSKWESGPSAPPRKWCHCRSTAGRPESRRRTVDVPEKLKYSAEHEWLAVDGKTGTVGITAFAVEQIGDIVFVELPAIGSTVEATKAFGVIESVKAVSELFAPASGKVVAINAALADAPETVARIAMVPAG